MLLFFSTTTAKVYNVSIEIWRYQRYGMIVDFEERMPLPPPLTILCYLFYILKWLGNLIYKAISLLCARARCCGTADHKVLLSAVHFNIHSC
jgi:hypothetical protein